MFTLQNKKTKEFVQFEVSSNGDAEFSNSEQYVLTASGYGDMYWFAPNRIVAERALATNTAWYNADYSTPSHGYDFRPAEWEVVEVELVVKD
jgi:hypothetical protein